MKDRLRELQRYSQRMWGMEKSCVGDWLNRNEVLAALASQPSDLKAKLEALRELLRETVKCIGDNMDVAGTEWQDAPMKTWMQKWEAALAEPASGPKETSVERNLTEHQKQVEEAAGMSLDWPMANAATVAAIDLRAKLESLRDEAARRNAQWMVKRLTAIIEGKD